MCGNTLSFLYGKLSQIHIYHVLLNTCMEILFVRSLLVIQLPLYDSYLSSFYSYSYSYSQSYSYYSCNKMKHLKLKNHWYQSYETERIARPMSLDDKLCMYIDLDGGYQTIYIIMKQKVYRYYVIKGQKSKNCFFGLLPIPHEGIESEPWNLMRKCCLPPLIHVNNVVWNWPIGEQQLFIVCHTTYRHIFNLDFYVFQPWDSDYDK